MQIKFWIFGDTDIGAKRKENQDSMLFLSGQIQDRQVGLAVVADGMGGLSYGEIASKMVISALENWWYQQMPICIGQELEWKVVSDSIDYCISQVNQQIYNFGLETGTKLGTTITLAFLIDKQILIKNIGDSRGYFLKENELIQFTRDDSYQQFYRDQGYSEEELYQKGIAQNILTKCLGIKSSIQADEQMILLNSDIFLCTDGVYQYISEDKLQYFLQRINIDTEEDYRQEIRKEIFKNGAGDNWSYIFIKKIEQE